MNLTTDTITRKFVDGAGITELENGEQFAEPIRAMTAEEEKERLELNQANTTSAKRAQVVAYNALTNGSGNGKVPGL